VPKKSSASAAASQSRQDSSSIENPTLALEVGAAIKIQRAYRKWAKAQLMKAAAEAIDYTDHLRRMR